jgi:lysosomal alpha-mannosidase
MNDDGRGVGEPLNETGLDGNGLIIRGVHRLSLDVAADAPAARRSALGDLSLRPLQQFAPLGAATPSSWVAANTAFFSGLAAPVAPQLQILTVHSWGPNQLLVRVAHSYESADGAMGVNASVSLTNLFAGFNLTDITEMTLTANRPIATAPSFTYQVDGIGAVTLPVVPSSPAGPAATVSLSAMQIRTFRCTVAAA